MDERKDPPFPLMKAVVPYLDATQIPVYPSDLMTGKLDPARIASGIFSVHTPDPDTSKRSDSPEGNGHA